MELSVFPHGSGLQFVDVAGGTQVVRALCPLSAGDRLTHVFTSHGSRASELKLTEGKHSVLYAVSQGKPSWRHGEVLLSDRLVMPSGAIVVAVSVENRLIDFTRVLSSFSPVEPDEINFVNRCKTVLAAHGYRLGG